MTRPARARHAGRRTPASTAPPPPVRDTAVLFTPFGQAFRPDPTDPTGAHVLDVTDAQQASASTSTSTSRRRDAAPLLPRPPPLRARARALAARLAVPFYVLIAVWMLASALWPAGDTGDTGAGDVVETTRLDHAIVAPDNTSAPARQPASQPTHQPAHQPAPPPQGLPIRERFVVLHAPGGVPRELRLALPWPAAWRGALVCALCAMLAWLRLHDGFEAGFLSELATRHGDKSNNNNNNKNSKRDSERDSNKPALARVGAHRLAGVLALRALLWYVAITVARRPREFNQDVLFRADAPPGARDCKQRVSAARERAHLLWGVTHCARAVPRGEFYAVRVGESAHSVDGARHVCVPGTEQTATGRVRLLSRDNDDHDDDGSGKMDADEAERRTRDGFHFPLKHLHAFCRAARVECGNVTRVSALHGLTYVGRRGGERSFTLELSNEARPGLTAVREAIAALQDGLSTEVATRHALGAHVELVRSSCFARARTAHRASLHVDMVVVALPWLAAVVAAELLLELVGKAEFDAADVAEALGLGDYLAS